MFNVIDNLTDISQLTDYVFSNESEASPGDGLGGSNRGDTSGKNDVQNAASNATVDYPKLATPILEGDTNSNLSLLDHDLTDEEVYRYLSLFSDNNLQLVDELDLENTLQPCSSINSNATTVSTQETNEFRENLLNAEVAKGEKDGGEQSSGNVPDVSNGDYPTATSTANQTNADQMAVVQSSPDTNQTNQVVYVESSTTEMSMTSSMSDSNQMAGCQGQMGQEIRVDYGQGPVTYYPNNLMNGQMSQMTSQMNQFQYTNGPASMAGGGIRMSFMGSETMANSNLVQTIGYREMNGGTFLANGSTFSANGLPPTAGYPPSNPPEYFTYAECRDVNCPYTYCSRYNPYYNNFPFRNQFRPGYGDNFLPDASTNMNVIDNQIVFSKQSDQPFNSVLTPATGQTASRPKTTKRAKHKQPKSEYTQTSVICNESTDYAFFTLEENLRSKRKRGRKKKAATVSAESDAAPESTK